MHTSVSQVLDYIPKKAVDAGSIQSDGVLSNGRVTESDPMAELTEQSEFEAVFWVVSAVESESDLDFTLDKLMDILIVNYYILTYSLAKRFWCTFCTFCDY